MTLVVCPGWFTTSIPLLLIVNVCGMELTFCTVIVSPCFTVRFVGEKTRASPGPCSSVTLPLVVACDDGLETDGVLFLPQAALVVPNRTIRPTKATAGERIRSM